MASGVKFDYLHFWGEVKWLGDSAVSTAKQEVELSTPS